MFKQLSREYSGFYASARLPTRLFRWLFGISKLHSQRQNSFNSINHNFCHAFQIKLSELQQKKVHMNRFTRWLTDIDSLIDQYKIVVEKAVTIRDDLFLASLKESRKTDFKSDPHHLHYKYQKSSQQLMKFETHLKNKIQFIKTLPKPEFKTIKNPISYFTRGFGFQKRRVFARVSANKPQSYANLMSEIIFNQQEMTKLRKQCPADYNVNRIETNPVWQSWSDAVDDCDARINYAKAILEKQKETAIEVSINEKGQPFRSL